METQGVASCVTIAPVWVASCVTTASVWVASCVTTASMWVASCVTIASMWVASCVSTTSVTQGESRRLATSESSWLSQVQGAWSHPEGEEVCYPHAPRVG